MKSKLWKFYTSFYIFLLVGSLVSTAAFGFQRIELLNYFLKISFFTLLVIELIGFSWKKPILQQWFWKVISVIGFALFIFYSVPSQLFSISQSDSSDKLLLIFSNFIGLLFLAPLFFALYFYAFRSRELWEKQ